MEIWNHHKTHENIIFPHYGSIKLPSSSAQNLEGSLSTLSSRASTFLPVNFVEELPQMFTAPVRMPTAFGLSTEFCDFFIT